MVCWHIFHWVIVTAKFRLNPTHICLDFEKAMTNAAREQFPDTILVGCFFHFKQALHKQMGNLGICKQQIKMAMSENCIDILRIMPKKEILKKGTPYVQDAIKSSGLLNKDDNKKWDKFWVHFKKFWMSNSDFISLWNIDGDAADEVKMHTRVNNGLER